MKTLSNNENISMYGKTMHGIYRYLLSSIYRMSTSLRRYIYIYTYSNDVKIFVITISTKQKRFSAIRSYRKNKCIQCVP